MNWLDKYQFGGGVASTKYVNPYTYNLPAVYAQFQGIKDSNMSTFGKAWSSGIAGLNWFAKSKLEKEQQKQAEEIAMRNMNDNYQNNMYAPLYNQSMSMMEEGGMQEELMEEDPSPSIFELAGYEDPFANLLQEEISEQGDYLEQDFPEDDYSEEGEVDFLSDTGANYAQTNQEDYSNEDLSDSIAAVESGGWENPYKAVPRKKDGSLASSAAGKYQFLWETHKPWIKKVTGVKTKEEFLNKPEAQEKAFQFWDNNTLTPGAKQLAPYAGSLTEKQLKMLIHFKGLGGAKEYLTEGVDRTQANNMSIPSYLGVAYREKGGIIDPMGQYNHPGKPTMVPTSNGHITMKGINYPVFGIDELGNSQLMQPNQDYQFPGKNVMEYPVMQDGGLKSHEILKRYFPNFSMLPLKQIPNKELDEKELERLGELVKNNEMSKVLQKLGINPLPKLHKTKTGYVDMDKYGISLYDDKGNFRPDAINFLVDLKNHYPDSDIRAECNEPGCAGIAGKASQALFGNRIYGNAWENNSTPVWRDSALLNYTIGSGQPLPDPTDYTVDPNVYNSPAGMFIGLNRTNNRVGELAENRDGANDSYDYANKDLYPDSRGYEHVGLSLGNKLLLHGSRSGANHPAYFVIENMEDGIQLDRNHKYKPVEVKKKKYGGITKKSKNWLAKY